MAGEYSTTGTITNLQEKVIGPARMTLKDDALSIKSSYQIERGRPGMDDTFNSPKIPGVTAFGLTEGVEMVSESLVDSNVAISATEVGVSVLLTEKMLRTVSRDQFLRDAGKAMGSAINVKQEQDFAVLIDGYGTVVGLDGASATIGQLSAGLNQLRASTEPVSEAEMRNVSAVLHPYAWHDIALLLFPTGSGEAHAPNTPTPASVAERTFNRYGPTSTYFGTPIKLSTNVVASGANFRSGIFHRKSALIYEFMPVELKTDEFPRARAIELNMVIDYGSGELLDSAGREWDHDGTAPTS